MSFIKKFLFYLGWLLFDRRAKDKYEFFDLLKTNQKFIGEVTIWYKYRSLGSKGIVWFECRALHRYGYDILYESVPKQYSYDNELLLAREVLSIEVLVREILPEVHLFKFSSGEDRCDLQAE